MRIIIFGSTGVLGSRIVAKALLNNYQVTAFTRNPLKLNNLDKANLTIIQGDVTNYIEVEKAINGFDAVICALGDGSKGEIRAPGTYNIIKAMQKKGLRRLICQSTLGIGESRKNLNFFWKHIMFGFILRKAYNDHKLQEEYIFASGLDFTIVRASAFTHDLPTGNFKVGFGPDEKNLSLKISLYDIADFILQQTDSNQFIGKAVSISN